MSPWMSLAGLFGNFGTQELIIFFAIVLVIFGPKKLPGLGRALGTSIKEFKESVKGLGNVLEEDQDESARKDQTAKADSAQASDTPPAEEPPKG